MRNRIRELFVALALLAAFPMRAATITWTNTVGGNWSATTNWSPNQVPGSSDTAVITAPGTYTVTFDESATIAGLTLGGSSGTETFSLGNNTLTLNGLATINTNGLFDLSGGILAGTNTFAGTINWTAGSIGGSANITIATNGTLVMAGNNGSDYSMAGILTNAGTIQLESGNLELSTYGGPGELVNLPGALINIASNVSIDTYNWNGIPVLINEGTVEKTGGTGTSTINPTFDNFGLLGVQSGTVSINNGGSGTGIFEADAGAILEFANSYSGNGGSQFIGAGTNLITGGTFALNGIMTVSNLDLAGGTLAGTNGVISGVLTWTSGSIASGSTLTIATNGTLVLAGNNGTDYSMAGILTNAGTIQLESGNLELSTYGGPGELVNLPGALINIASNVSIDTYNWNGIPVLINEGTVEKTGGTGTSTINPTFDNFGLLGVQSGTMSINNSYSLTNGTLNVGINGSTNFGAFTLSGSPAQLNGSLSANLNDGYAPATGTSIPILVYSSVSGQFTNLTLPVLGASQVWQIAYTSRTGLLQVVSNTNSTWQITGSVTDNQGNGVTNIGVFAYTTNSATNQFFSAFTGVNGSYSMNVPNGIFQVGLEGLPNRGYDPVTNQVVTINNASQVVNFVLQPYGSQLYTVTTAIVPPGAGSAYGAGTYPEGTAATVSASPTPGPLPYWFGNWSENGFVLTTNSSYSLVVNGNHNLVANFIWPSPVITMQPQSQTVVTGAVLSLSVAVSGAQPMSYQWQFDGTNLVDSGQIVGSQSNILTIANVQLANAGDYEVSVANAYGSTNSEVAAVFVGIPITTLFNTGVNVQGVPLTNYTIGDPHYTLVSVPSDTNVIQVLNYGAWLPADTNSAWIGPDNDSSDDGPVGNYDYQTTFIITGNPTNATISGQCAEDNQLIGIYLNGQFTGINNSTQYGFSQWQPLAFSGITNDFVYGTNTLDFIVYNSGGPTGLRVEMTGMVVMAVGPPVIVTQPVSQSPSLGATAQFSVGAVGSEPLSYQWQLNGANLADNGSISGSESNLLNIPNVQLADSGNLQVIVTNSFGSVTSAVVSLSAGVSPGITTQPQNQAVGLGGTAVFTVSVSGTGPFYYQWLFNGEPLPDANSSTLTLANVQANEQGQYSVTLLSDYGSVVSSAATLSVLGYCASAQPGQAIYPMGSVVPVTVQTLVCDSQTAVPNQIATVWISNNGFTRSLPATTGGSGSTVVDFVPLPTEAGFYQVAASLPGQAVPAAQSSFTIVGMALSTNNISAQGTPGVEETNIIILTNLTGVSLTGLSVSVIGPTPDVTVQLNVPGTLSGNTTGQLSCVLTAPGNAQAQDQFDILLTSAQGTTNLVSVTAAVVPSVPQLAATPSPLNAAMVQGGQTLVNFWVANIGGATSGPVSVILPQESWLTQVTPQPIPPLVPGQSNQITLALTASTNLTLGAYTGNLELTSSNATDLSVPFTFNCISTSVGALQVTVQDELTYYSPGSPNVSNATITISDFQTGEAVTNAVTDASGIVLFTNLTSAYYTVSVTAPDHGAFSTTLLVSPDETNDLTAFLPLQLVDYTWLVTPTDVPDDYQFTLETTFETQVPWPVVTVSPAAIDLCTIQGDSTQIDLTITNSGLIAADGLNLYFGTHPDWSIQPLATSLGTLLPKTNLVVPITITRIGSSTDVPDQIAAQLSYYVPALNATNYTIVPIYVYDANPQECEPGTPTPTPVPVTCTSCAGGGIPPGEGGGGGSNTVTIIPPSYSPQTPQGALVEVQLQIDQSAVIARDGFHAALNLDNNAGSTISNLQVTVTVYDASNNVANSLFGIPSPTLSGLNAVDGTGVMANGASGQATWTIVPTTNAAPQTATQYSIGGTLSYTLNGEPVTVPLFPVPITVQPCPIFTVDYFLQHDVYSQDPFVSQYEPPIPFALGIIVKNTGYGSANDFSITSGQPEIVGNSNDLLIAFSLIGSQIGTNTSISPSFTLDFGDLGAQSSGVGLWYMTSTLDGQFVAFDASFQHVDDFGNTNTSLISTVNTYEMNHVVQLPIDSSPDFLVNDTTNLDALPDVVFANDGSTSPVTSLSISNTATIGIPSGTGGNVTVVITNTSIPSGWVYLEADDPSGGAYPIVSVQRSDGTSLLVGPNVWQTPQRTDLVPPQPNALIHIFDYNPTATYTVTYGQPITAPTASTAAATSVTNFSAVLNAVVDPDGANTGVYFQWGLTTSYGNSTESTTLTSDLYDSQAVALGVGNLQPNTTYHYQVVAINSAGTNFGADATFVTAPSPPPIITQITNRSIADGQYLIVSNRAVVAVPPVTWSLDSSDPAGALITTNGVFKWAPTCEQGSSNYLITIWATDNSTPPLSNSMTFSVAVGQCVQIAIGSTAVQIGQTGQVALTLISSIPLTNLNFTVLNPSGRFTDWAFASSNTSIENATLQTLDSSDVFINLDTFAGQTLQSQPVLGTFYLTPLPGPSAFVPLVGSNVLGTASDGTVAGDIESLPGRVAVIGLEPLIEAGLGSNSMRTFMLFGNPGTNYQVLFTTNLLSTNWQIWSSFEMTNLMQSVPLDQTSPQIFYRALGQP